MSLELQTSQELFVDPTPFPLERGGQLPALELVHESIGPEGAPLVVVAGGISAGAHASSHEGDARRGWWEGMVGSGKAIDSDRYRVLGFEYLGGVGGSSGPASSGWPDPAITALDQARALIRLLDHSGVGSIEAFVGASFGGQVGLALASEAPARVGRLVLLCAAHEPDAWSQAFRSRQRALLRLGREQGIEEACLSLARGLAMLSCRSREEFRERFGVLPLEEAGHGGSSDRSCVFPAEAYLEARGVSFVERFDLRALEVLSQAIDLSVVEPEGIGLPMTLVGVRSDALVPIEQIRELADRLAGPVELHEIDSIYGHDAFLKEGELLAPILRKALGGRR